MAKKRNLQLKAIKLPAKERDLIQDLRTMIVKTRQSVAVAINSSLTALYWKIGHRIRLETLHEKRADYGKEIVATVSRQLALEFGQGFAEKSLRMLQFAEVFSDYLSKREKNPSWQKTAKWLVADIVCV